MYISQRKWVNAIPAAKSKCELTGFCYSLCTVWLIDQALTNKKKEKKENNEKVFFIDLTNDSWP